MHVLETPRAPREAIYRSATIVTLGGAQRNVALKQLSVTGARIEFHSREPLPEQFVLIEPIRGLRRRVRVVWQDDFVAGVAFVDG